METSLLSLPNELILEIAPHLGLGRDLTGLACANRRLASLLTPYRYKAAIQEGYGGNFLIRAVESNNVEKMRLLVHTYGVAVDGVGHKLPSLDVGGAPRLAAKDLYLAAVPHAADAFRELLAMGARPLPCSVDRIFAYAYGQPSLFWGSADRRFGEERILGRVDARLHTDEARFPRRLLEALLLRLAPGAGSLDSRSVSGVKCSTSTRIDVGDSVREGALHLAVRASAVALVKLLLRKGADPNLKAKYGFTPLFYASDPDIARNLIAHGAKAHTTARKRTADIFLRLWIKYHDDEDERSALLPERIPRVWLGLSPDASEKGVLEVVEIIKQARAPKRKRKSADDEGDDGGSRSKKPRTMAAGKN